MAAFLNRTRRGASPGVAALLGVAVWLLGLRLAFADGMVIAPREYRGSLEERAQEAIIVFHPGDETHSATEDLILKIRVEGPAERFAWVIALPNEPRTAREDAALFDELHRYVQARLSSRSHKSGGKAAGVTKNAAPAAEAPVEVLSRKVVGSYDVAVVRERQPGALSGWLEENGYRALEGAEDLIASYRKKGYVFACVKVSDVARAEGPSADLHPLRFSFETGGRDGIYFPMRLTGLQKGPFDVNLYVLYNKWVNDRVSRFGYVHRGFELTWRDYDGPRCTPNAGKSWSDPGADPYLREYAGLFPAVTKLVRKLHPGERYYLTNLQARGLAPADVRDWPDDLWLFPYYTDPRMVPFDARDGGPASGAYPHAARDEEPAAVPAGPRPARLLSTRGEPPFVALFFGGLFVGVVFTALLMTVGWQVKQLLKRGNRSRPKATGRFSEIA
jgi:hypothetical protein